MTPTTLEALQASIAHWKRVTADRSIERVGRDTCGLCKLFNHLPNYCHGCPVMNRIGLAGCRGTPYYVRTDPEWGLQPLHDVQLEPLVTEDKWRTYAQAEVDFLESLMPNAEVVGHAGLEPANHEGI